MKKQMHLLFGLLILLNGIDALTTMYLVSITGVEVEANPFMREIIRHGGGLAMIAYKFLAIFVLFICVLFAEFKRRAVTLALIGLYLCIAVFTIISIHNLVIVYTL